MEKEARALDKVHATQGECFVDYQKANLKAVKPEFTVNSYINYIEEKQK